MKRTSPRKPPNKTRRVVRRAEARAASSQRALRQAMNELLHERPFAEITVQQLLQRAGVGRTTFYAHFQDKDDLLLASFTRMFESMAAQLANEPPTQRRLAPVREFFEHVDEGKQLLHTLGADKIADLWRLTTLHFVRLLEPHAVDAATARFLAGGLVEQLEWWLGAAERPTAAAMDARFHALAARVLRPH